MVAERCYDVSMRPIGGIGAVALLAAALGACGGGGGQCPAAGSSASSAAPELVVEGESQTAYHSHGGAGAMISQVGLLVKNRGDAPHTLRVLKVERLHGSCNAPGWDSADPLTVREPSGAITVEPGEDTRIAVIFDPVECYNACDRFGFRVHVDVDGEPREVIAELEVQREADEP